MRRPLLATVLVAFALTLGACASPAADTASPQGVVARVLELRRDRATDTASYTPYFAEASVATELAKDSTTATRTPLPAWSDPYVSAQTSSTADVVVVWSRSEERFKQWPAATVFALRLEKGAWVIVDAQETTGTTPPAKGASGP